MRARSFEVAELLNVSLSVLLHVQVRSSFRRNEDLKQTDEILKAKAVATKAIGDYYTAQAYRLAVKERVAQHPEAVMPAAFQRSLEGTPHPRSRTPRRSD